MMVGLLYFYACMNGHKEIVKYLVERGTNINKKNNDGYTSLYYACEKGHEYVVK